MGEHAKQVAPESSVRACLASWQPNKQWVGNTYHQPGQATNCNLSIPICAGSFIRISAGINALLSARCGSKARRLQQLRAHGLANSLARQLAAQPSRTAADSYLAGLSQAEFQAIEVVLDKLASKCLARMT